MSSQLSKALTSILIPEESIQGCTYEINDRNTNPNFRELPDFKPISAATVFEENGVLK